MLILFVILNADVLLASSSFFFSPFDCLFVF